MRAPTDNGTPPEVQPEINQESRREPRKETSKGHGVKKKLSHGRKMKHVASGVASAGARKLKHARQRVTYRVKGGVVHIDGAMRAGAKLVAKGAKRSLGRATWRRPKLMVDWHRHDDDVNLTPPVRRSSLQITIQRIESPELPAVPAVVADTSSLLRRCYVQCCAADARAALRRNERSSRRRAAASADVVGAVYVAVRRGPVACRRRQLTRRFCLRSAVFDLLLVAACLKMGSYMKSDLTAMGLLRLLSMASLFWQVWLSQTLYNCRYHAQDTAHLVIALVTCLGMTGMAVNVTDADHMPKQANLFTASFLLARFSEIVLAFEVWKTSQRSRFDAKWSALSLVSTSVVASVAFFLPYETQFIAWLMTFPVARIVQQPAISAPEARRIPLHVGHFAERHGELAMLALGEAVISLSLPLVEDGVGHPLFVACGTLLIVLLQTLYMEAQPGEQSFHALRQSVKSSTYYMLAHFALFVGLILVGVGLKVFLLHLTEELHLPETWLLCGATSLCLRAIHAIQLAHKAGFRNTLGGQTRESTQRGSWTFARVGITLMPLLIPIGVHRGALGPVSVLLLITLVCAIEAVLENMSRDEVKEDVEWAEDDRYKDDAIVAAIVEQAARSGGRGLTADEVEYLKSQYEREIAHDHSTTESDGEDNPDAEAARESMDEAGDGVAPDADADKRATGSAEASAAGAVGSGSRANASSSETVSGSDTSMDGVAMDAASANADGASRQSPAEGRCSDERGSTAATPSPDAEELDAPDGVAEDKSVCCIVCDEDAIELGDVHGEGDEVRRLKMHVRCLRRTLRGVLEDRGETEEPGAPGGLV